MASLFQRTNGIYYVAFHDATRTPTRKYVSTRTTRKKEAERVWRRIESAAMCGQFDPWRGDDFRKIALPKTGAQPVLSPVTSVPNSVTVGEGVASFLRSRANLSPYTRERYRSICERFAAFVGPSTPVSLVSGSDVQRFIQSTDTKAITRLNYRKALSTLFGWLMEGGSVANDPTKSVRLERVPEKYPRFLSAPDVESICAAIVAQQDKPHVESGTGLWLLPIVRANVYLGLRAGEVVNALWEDVDFERRTLTVRNTDDFTTKAGKERTLPLCDAVLDVLKSIDPSGRYIFPNYGGTQLHRLYLSRAFKHFVRLAALPEYINFHTTRHTSASWLAQSGCSVEAIRRYMGHSSITVTQRYMHLSEDTMASQISRAFDR